MSGSFSGTDTGLSVLGGLVGKGELSEIPADHVELDLYVVEGLAVVDSDVGSDHLGQHDGVSEMGLDRDGLLTSGTVLLGLFALGVKTIVSVFDLCMG